MKILVFAGTDEGRKICEYLSGSNAEVTASTATEYGAVCLSHLGNIHVREGRLSLEEMETLVKEYDLTVDATHPYAKVCTDHIRAACEASGAKLIRIQRPAEQIGACQTFESIEAVCSYLSSIGGNILVTTGSKELAPYAEIPNYQKRVFLRVLPVADSLAACLHQGFPPSNIICMQGPFSEEMNIATLRSVHARFMVTKETGKAGGFTEKLSAAEKAGVTVLVVGRPAEESGMTLEEAQAYLHPMLRWDQEPSPRFPLFVSIKNKQILVVGGGTIAARRVNSLLPFGPNITVVAPELSEHLQGGGFTYIQDSFREAYLDHAQLVIAATNQRDVNQLVCHSARGRGIPVNCADDKDACDFYFPALFSAGNIIGGLVSKTGGDHGLVKETAGKIRALLDRSNGYEEN